MENCLLSTEFKLHEMRFLEIVVMIALLWMCYGSYYVDVLPILSCNTESND